MSHTVVDQSLPAELQISFVTDDLERSTAWFAELLGIPVPDLRESPPPEEAHPEYLGVPSLLRCRQSILRWAGVVVEFIEPNNEPSTWREFLERKGPGVHHLGFVVRDRDAVSDRLADAGYPSVQQGDFVGGRYSYSDTEPALGALIELLEYDRNVV